MNDTLRKTHTKENIDLLKARDVFFDEARKRNKWHEVAIVIPPVVAGLTYLPILLQFFPVIDELRDYIIGIVTIIFVFICEFLEKKNEDTLEISNALREEYDVKVFDIEKNHLAFNDNIIKNPNGQWKEEIIKAWQSKSDYDKYEVWYTEFSGQDHRTNVLCNQMDNIIYTYHVYNAYKKKLRINIFLGMFVIISILLYSAFIWKSLSAFIMIMFSLFEAFESQLAQYKTINQLISVNDYIYKKIRDNSTEIKEILSDDKTGNTFLRSLQDVIVNNREKSLFIPKSIRLIYLKNGNPFYKQLDEIKQIYMKEPFIPEKAEDIDILSSSGENVIATVKDVHDHLREMLIDVDKVFREANIKYLLDGGSLIGACRDDGFVFWDDDIDLAIMIDDVEKAKRIITEKLGDKYNVQDYDNDDFYSPRLSNFRIREKNEISILEEKDSELYEKYNFRGLFIDVYAYTPIVVNKKIDSFLRKLLIQGFRFNIFGKTFSKGIYNRIRKEEAACKYDNTSKNKHELCFKKLKEKYLRRVKYYLKLTNNSEYYAYVPNYVEHLNAPGPYIKAESLFSTETQFNEINFEGINVTIPASPDDVLSAYYGNWKKSPFIGLNDLKDNEGNYKFSSKVFDATVLKHYKYINKLEEIKL